MIIILFDNGHGENTPGKRSPDGKFLEYLYAREVAQECARRLRSEGYNAVCIVRESIDVPLSERVKRVNEYCKEYGAKNVVLISVHVNAAGKGDKWMNARGFSVYTSKGKTKSDDLATMLYIKGADNFTGQTLRKEFSDGDPDWEDNFSMLQKTKCAAVITENFFMDNEQDVAYLESKEGKEAIINTHVQAIIEYVKKYGKG